MTEPELVLAAVTVRGIVQGVGFRPFVHRLAQASKVNGWVRNTAAGVQMEISGSRTAVAAFTAALRTKAPPLAVIEQVRVRRLPLPTGFCGFDGFLILPSAAGAHDTLLSPDVGLCPDCLREMRTPGDRRFRYPFINCTNCGPRFTIAKTLPYDRANTTMARFAMCPDCSAEYQSLRSRRYHAQPNSCANCGPRLWFAGADGVPTEHQTPDEAIAAAQALLLAGGILAVKGLGGFHLACLAEAPAPVQELRRRKHRDEKPFAVMCPDVLAARRLCRVNAAEESWLESFRRPIVLLQKRQPQELLWLSGNDCLGVMLPYTPLHLLLFDPVLRPDDNTPQCQTADRAAPVFSSLVMTSANRSDCPVETQNDEAVRNLRGLADGFLLNDRDIAARCDDSLLFLPPRARTPCLLRRSRGFVPQPVTLGFSADGIWAFGAEQKAGFALGKGRRAFLSQHIGDLKNAQTLAHFEQQLDRFSTLFGAPGSLFVCDLHPDYLSARLARERAEATGAVLLPVQHHRAHMAACMADNRLAGQCIGVVWDGTGLGDDGTVWGGEFFAGGLTGAERLASLRPALLPGGDAAVKEIGRVGLSLAWDAGCPEQATALPPEETRAILAMLQKGLNCPKSSGMGRLFDGMYSLLCGRAAVSYEGQGAVLLEALAHAAEEKLRHGGTALPAIRPQGDTDQAGLWRWDTRPLVRAMISGRNAGFSAAALALQFHESLAQLALAACQRIRRQTGLTRVVLSGGVFANRWLLGRLGTLLFANGFTVYRHRRVAPNDEGIALGQLAIAAALRDDKN